MTREEKVERIAAGLRAVKVTPNALLFVEEVGSDCWPDDTELGIPVLFGFAVECRHVNGDSVPCPFVPLWSHERPVRDGEQDCKRFCDAYSEWSSDQ